MQVEVWLVHLLQIEKQLEEPGKESRNLPLLEFNPLLLNKVHLSSKHFAKQDPQAQLEFSLTEQGVIFFIVEGPISVKILNEELHFIQELFGGI